MDSLPLLPEEALDHQYMQLNVEDGTVEGSAEDSLHQNELVVR